MNTRTRLIDLARTFPTLVDAPLEPWNAEKLDSWAAPVSSGTKHAVRFVLAVWNGSNNNPTARLRGRLLDVFERTLEGCSREASRRGEASAAAGRLARKAEVAIDKMRDAYLAGDRSVAYGHALQAAALAPAWEGLARWLSTERATSEAAVLAQLAQAEVWQVGPFDVMAALGTWDAAHRAAFVAWAAAPWWE